MMKMFWQIYKFELRYWIGRPMVYVFFLIYFLMILGAVSSDQITIGEAIGNVKRNAPLVLQFQYAIMVLLGMLGTTAFIQAATLRDFSYNSYQLIFSTPMGKFPYLAGRYFGAITIALIPFLAVGLASVVGTHIAPVFGWMPAERFQPTNWMAHFHAFTLFVIPNTLFVGAIIFAIASLTRSTMLSFIGIILVLVLYAISGTILGDLENERIAIFTDPMGMRPFSLATKYWTVADKNANAVTWANSSMALNRLIWLGVSLGLMTFTAMRFSFAERNTAWWRRTKKSTVTGRGNIQTHELVLPSNITLPSIAQKFGSLTNWLQLKVETKTNFLHVVKGVAFQVILIAGILNMAGSLTMAKGSFGLSALPVTYNQVDLIRGSMYLFLVAVVIFYSGALVWREREAKMDQIYDATPHHAMVSFFSKTLAMIGAVALILTLCIVVGVIGQASLGYSNFELQIYLVEMLVIDLLGFSVFVVVSLFLHTVINNKYIAFFIFLVLVISLPLAKNTFHISSNMIGLADLPNYTYSDMNGWGPYIPALAWFSSYWVLLAAVLGLVTTLLWVRGTDYNWSSRFNNARNLFTGKTRVAGLAIFAAFAACAGWVYYNTEILNPYEANFVNEKQQAIYEKNYKQYEHMQQPNIRDVKFDIALYPSKRQLVAKGDFILVNRQSKAIDTLLFSFDETTECEVFLKEQASLLLDDQDCHFQMYRLNEALQPGEEMLLHFESTYVAKGFENELSVSQIVQNGSFFNHTHFSPIIGYVPEAELVNPNDRRRQDLPDRQRMPSLERECSESCNRPYLPNADWVTLETTISTSEDQIAVAPGSLIKEWNENGRNFYTYRLDHPSVFFASFISARYEVAREKWNGIDIEVYYDSKHPYNVANMLNSVQKSLAYYTENFGPYYHKQARIIEFPRYASFAQAFPGTMPYSEGIGFIADIEEETDIDMVFYVVAHEMGHQWWAHQVLGAYMQGATLLSESLSQYSALMVMEKEFGRDRMGKFLKYERDSYLEQRSGETIGELPLMEVEGQAYVHYRKGSIALYHLKEAIGEKRLNAALYSLVDSFAYHDGNYPTAHHLMDRLRLETPDSLQSLLTDLFEDIILYDNRTIAASYSTVEAIDLETVAPLLETDDKVYEVKLEVSAAKFRADSLGSESPLPLNDWIDLGVLAKPKRGQKEGKILAQKRVLLTEEKSTHTFYVVEEPHMAGFDPLNYLVDRVPADNMKRVEKLD